MLVCLTLVAFPPAVRAADSSCRPEVGNGAPGSRTQLLHATPGGRFRFLYLGSDGVAEYCLLPGRDFWGPVNVKLDRLPVAHVLVGAGPVFPSEPDSVRLVEAWPDGEKARARWEVLFEGESVEVESSLELRGRSLWVEYVARGAGVAGVSFGRLTDVAAPEFIAPPAAGPACPSGVLKATGPRTFFASLLTCPPGAGIERADAEILSGGEVLLGGNTVRFAKTPPEGYRATGVLTLSRALRDVLPETCDEPR
jgi:hypothetical protein